MRIRLLFQDACFLQPCREKEIQQKEDSHQQHMYVFVMEGYHTGQIKTQVGRMGVAFVVLVAVRASLRGGTIFFRAGLSLTTDRLFRSR